MTREVTLSSAAELTMYCPDCQTEVRTYPNSHASGIQHCLHCRQVAAERRPRVSLGDNTASRDKSSLTGALGVGHSAREPAPLADVTTAEMQWRIDADLQASQQFIRAWRQQNSAPSPGRQSRRRRIDLLERMALDTRELDHRDEAPSVVSARSANSIVPIVICELTAIVALVILLVIEAQHRPSFLQFAAVALVGAGAVLLLTWVRSDRAVCVEPVVPTAPDHE